MRRTDRRTLSYHYTGTNCCASTQSTELSINSVFQRAERTGVRSQPQMDITDLLRQKLHGPALTAPMAPTDLCRIYLLWPVSKEGFPDCYTPVPPLTIPCPSSHTSLLSSSHKPVSFLSGLWLLYEFCFLFAGESFPRYSMSSTFFG